MKKIMMFIASLALVFGATVAVAQPAQAMQITACQDYRTPSGLKGVFLYEDYNWWEETFQGKHDRWVWKPYLYCA